MKIRFRTFAILFTLGFLCLEWLTLPALACTTFCFEHKGSGIFGRNYDWETDSCLIMVNKRNVTKRALSGTNRAQWVSQYGSITFNQYGREFPLGGMNEMGLVVECMWLQEAKYPENDARTDLSELQWIQFQLDTAENVNEVINSDKKIRITGDSSPLHFLVSDYRGRVAVIEFIDGKMKSYAKKDLPYPVLANTTYEKSLKPMAKLKGNETTDFLKKLPDSYSRFAIANQGVVQWGKNNPADPIEYAFKVLQDLTQERTMFSIVYDPLNRRIHYRTKQNREIRFINFAALDFSCKTPVKILDIRLKSSKSDGNITASFKDYSTWANYSLIKRSWAETPFLKGRPESEITLLAQYPDSLLCKK